MPQLPNIGTTNWGTELNKYVRQSLSSDGGINRWTTANRPTKKLNPTSNTNNRDGANLDSNDVGLFGYNLDSGKFEIFEWDSANQIGRWVELSYKEKSGEVNGAGTVSFSWQDVDSTNPYILPTFSNDNTGYLNFNDILLIDGNYYTYYASNNDEDRVGSSFLPNIPAVSNGPTVTVNNLASGLVNVSVADSLSVGDVITMNTPVGEFTHVIIKKISSTVYKILDKTSLPFVTTGQIIKKLSIVNNKPFVILKNSVTHVGPDMKQVFSVDPLGRTYGKNFSSTGTTLKDQKTVSAYGNGNFSVQEGVYAGVSLIVKTGNDAPNQASGIMATVNRTIPTDENPANYNGKIRNTSAVTGVNWVNSVTCDNNTVSDTVYSLYGRNLNQAGRCKDSVGLYTQSYENLPGSPSYIENKQPDRNWGIIQHYDWSNPTRVQGTRSYFAGGLALGMGGYAVANSLNGSSFETMPDADKQAVYASIDEVLVVFGNIRAAGTITPGSDLRWKEDILKVENALTKVTELKGVTYNWKDKEVRGADRQIGLIAQDVEKVFPEAVKKDAKGYMSVNYDGLVGALVEAIKELKAEIEELKKKVA